MIHRSRNNNSGYTLIELAVVIAVVGVVMAAGGTAYNLYQKNKTETENTNNLRVISSYMNSYLMQHGHYPCPARIDVARTDSTYGIAGDCTVAGATVAAGTCASGVCVENGARQVDVVPDPNVTDMQTVRVRRGALPFRSMAMPEKNALDGYKMRYNYAITEILAAPGTYQRESGAIAIVDGTNQTVVEPANSAHFVIFSSGSDKAGAYTAAGVLHKPCDTTTLDGENCNTSTTNNVATYRMMARSHAGGANHFDDDVRFYSSVETPLWQVADASGADIRDLVDAESGGKIGIGSSNPEVTLDIGGNTRVENQTRLTQICSLTGGDCFDVSNIGGDVARFQCDNPAHPDYDPAKPYVIGVGMDKVTCGSTPEIRCPSGQIVVGVNATNGTLECAAFTPPVMCPATVFTECQGAFPPDGLSITVPATPLGGQVGPIYFGNGVNRRGYFTCLYDDDGVTPIFRGVSLFGTCNACVAGTVVGSTTAMQCNVLMGGGYWSGSVTADVTTVCPPGGLPPVVTITPTSNTCSCEEGSYTWTSPCPAGYTSGTVTNTHLWTCDASGAAVVTYPPPVSTCSCATADATQTLNCPIGYTGTWTQTKTAISCPPAVWGPWTPATPPAGACTCNPSGPYTTTLPCPSGYTGAGIVMGATFDCTTQTMGPYDQLVANNCSLTSYSWVTGGTPSSLGSQVGPLAGDTCTNPGGTSACSVPAGSQFQPYSACTCQ